MCMDLSLGFLFYSIDQYFCLCASTMGAKIKVDGRIVVIEGGAPLTPAPVIATDLRGGMAVLIAALATEGKTEISDIHLIERGYDEVCAKFRELGADIEKIVIPEPAKIQKAN